MIMNNILMNYSDNHENLKCRYNFFSKMSLIPVMTVFSGMQKYKVLCCITEKN